MFVQMLDHLKIVAKEETATKGVYEISPLPTGYGNTVGNALRRILLSSIPGAAITTAVIDGVDHQFSTLSGVKEDVLRILLNCKEIRVKIYGDNPIMLKLSATGPKKVTAGDLEVVGDAEVFNKNLPIATLADKKSKLNMELVAEPGVGYVPADERGKSTKVGELMLDAIFTPILKAAYQIEAARVGGKTNLDKLILNVETDGTIGPREAMESASGILVKYFRAIGNIQEEEVVEVIAPEEAPSVETASESVMVDDTIEALGLSTRTTNALMKGGITTIKELLDREAEDLVALRGFGDTALEEVSAVLKKQGLALK